MSELRQIVHQGAADLHHLDNDLEVGVTVEQLVGLLTGQDAPCFLDADLPLALPSGLSLGPAVTEDTIINHIHLEPRVESRDG